MFPKELIEQGLSEKVLFSSLNEVQTGSQSHLWELNGIPSIGFYRALHTYLKRQLRSTKVLIGRFYATIDRNFREKGSRPDNIYRFVERIVASKRQSDEPMVYNIQVIKEIKSQLKKCSEQIDELHAECTELRQKFEISRNQLRCAKLALHDTTNENQSLKRKYEFTKLKVGNLKGKNELLEAECAKLQIENLDLFSDNDSNDESCDADTSYQSGDVESNLQDIVGHHKYSPEIRKLYYSLLANQVPVSKIANIIQTVLKCFIPDENVEELRLPKKVVQVICVERN